MLINLEEKGIKLFPIHSFMFDIIISSSEVI